MTGKGEGRAHSPRVNQYSLMRGETDHHGDAALEAAPDVDGDTIRMHLADEVVIHVLGETFSTML